MTEKLTSGRKTLEKEQKLTPMMEQYRSIQKTLPTDTILFFRLGDFYEMFFQDAIRASDILNITLTGREGGEAGRVPMCGIPYHAFQGYVRKLLDENLKVAVCEQMGDPKLAKGLVERKVTRIITPATYLDEESKDAAPEYMAAIATDGKHFALSFLELSTGEFCVREIPEDRLVSELSLLLPREVILPKRLAGHSPLVTYLKETLRVSLTVYEDWIFEAEEGLRHLTEAFRLASERSIPFSGQPLCVSASGAVLYYLKDHFHSALDHIRLPRLLDTSDYMILDRQTQRSLELVSGMTGKKGTTLLSAIDATRTSMGGRTLYQWVTHPLLTVREIRKRQSGVEELTRQSARTKSFCSLLEGIRDVERTLSRLNYGVANARDLLNLKIFLGKVPEIQELLSDARSEILKELLGALIPFPNLLDLIGQAIVDEPPLSVKEGGLIRDKYSIELDELRNIARNGRNWIVEFQKKEIERTGIKSLKIRYSQVFGYTIEVSQSNLNSVPSDYIRKQTLANAERFIVPELIEWDQKISGAEEKIKALEFRLFDEIRGKILEELAPLQEMAKAIGVLDALLSLAMIAVQKKWVKPEVTESQELRIEGGRHPVVEAMLPLGQFVENDALLDTKENQLIILTGPNMAGKSTYIRQVALIVLLAQMGSFVPARSARVGLVDRIFTRIGASDNLAGGESTFMVEMIEAAHILRNATDRSLLILDEVGRGTSTFDGVSIAWAICEHLAREGGCPRTLFATHYHELTQLEEHFPRVKNYNITVKETRDGIVFLRKVVRGGSDRSYGIHVARLAGIPKSVTDRASEILEILESENTEATQIIERQNRPDSKKDTGRQLTFFGTAKPEHPLLDEIRNSGVDRMTPLEALTKLAEWKKKLAAEGDGK
ncbi:MAG TPA: DNA mismatch repair protein MutS [Candidatus Omnitrophota bacterium]|nr:DNA mismatch repair protein MutS [Candidatus Omnitrophota bacterium]